MLPVINPDAAWALFVLWSVDFFCGIGKSYRQRLPWDNKKFGDSLVRLVGLMGGLVVCQVFVNRAIPTGDTAPTLAKILEGILYAYMARAILQNLGFVVEGDNGWLSQQLTAFSYRLEEKKDATQAKKILTSPVVRKAVKKVVAQTLKEPEEGDQGD